MSERFTRDLRQYNPAMHHYDTMYDIKLRNKQKGHHWFDGSTIGFFGSRVGNTVYGGCYFLESQPFAFNGPRVYFIREATPDGQIHLVCAKDVSDSPFANTTNCYDTRAQAMADLKKILAGELLYLRG